MMKTREFWQGVRVGVYAGFVATVVTAIIAASIIANHLSKLEKEIKDSWSLESHAIGRMKSKLVSEREVKRAAINMLAAEQGEWEKERRRFHFKIESLTKAVLSLETEIAAMGQGGAALSDDARKRVLIALAGEKLAWAYDTGRIRVETSDVLADPPFATVRMNQRFRIEAMIAERNKEKSEYVRLYEIDNEGRTISRAVLTDSEFTYTTDKPKWYDYVAIGARAGVEMNQDLDARVPVYGFVGYRNPSAFPWSVTLDPFAELNSRANANFQGAYGAGIYVNIGR